ncbi:MAG: 2-octaprenyl-3-methyl-6-methoxy,4-benzoquinol hydroxylase [Tardiphaga sp.]|nr:2-octaprenyl-3-methyl-6-methoxy,4-benzoquinol hydroxylase [Tardiphaga sp.]
MPAKANYLAMTSSPIQTSSFDVAVIGGGPAGLTAAIALGSAGARTALIARRAPYADNRTTALLGGSVELLERLDVWARCADQSAPLEVMRLVDDTKRLIRAPEVKFRAVDIGRDAFGHNIENHVLMAALEARASELPQLTRFDADADGITPADDGVAVTTRTGETLKAALVVGADGRQSLCREAAGISVTQHRLPQSALTFTVTHSRPHKNVSTEFHTAQGPCVFVPLPGDRCSVVWVAAPDEAERLMALDDAALSAAVETQAHHILGRMTVQPGRHLFPLSIERPQAFARNRIVLVGEAAHVLPPIGAQGLNMGLRDASDLAGIVASAVAAGDDIGAPAVLARYARARRGDVMSRTAVIDIANRSLLSDLLPMQFARAIGLRLIDAIGPLKRLAMREGLAPSWRS